MLQAVTTWVGVDLAQKSLDVAGLPEASVQTLPNTPDGQQQLINQLPAPGTCCVVVESTGGYERSPARPPQSIGESLAGERGRPTFETHTLPRGSIAAHFRHDVDGELWSDASELTLFRVAP